MRYVPLAVFLITLLKWIRIEKARFRFYYSRMIEKLAGYRHCWCHKVKFTYARIFGILHWWNSINLNFNWSFHQIVSNTKIRAHWSNVCSIIYFADPPEITVESPIVFSGEGQEAMLVCIVHGEAQPDVSRNYSNTYLEKYPQHIVQTMLQSYRTYFSHIFAVLL